jgi:magnesium chelatase subunit I
LDHQHLKNQWMKISVMANSFPFAAIVGQDEMTLAIQVVAIDPTVGGVLVLGDRGTGKSTAVRALADLLPPIRVVKGCPYKCDPAKPASACPVCQTAKSSDQSRTTRWVSENRPVSVVDLPLGATEDRIVGALDLEKALSQGIKEFSPGLLAQAHRGFLYIDEVNLLDDHLVDLLIDVAASGENLVEREGLSIRHPARFVLVGSGNPEEGELRPQLLDRFGLSVHVRTPQDVAMRVEVIKRRDAFDKDPAAYKAQWQGESDKLQKRIVKARKLLESVVVDDDMLTLCARLCQQLGTDGLRAELTLLRATRALAAMQGKKKVTSEHLITIAPLALRHRLRRNPLDDTDSGERVKRSLQDILAI